MKLEDKTDKIYEYLYKNGHKGFIADNELISNMVAFQYEIDKAKPKLWRLIKDNRGRIISLRKAGLSIDESLNQLFTEGGFIAKRQRKPAGWSFMFTEAELKDMEYKLGQANETRTENSYNIWDALDIKTRRFIQRTLLEKPTKKTTKKKKQEK